MAPFARRPCVRWLMRLWVLVPLCLFPPPYTHILTCVHLSVHVRRIRVCNCVLHTYINTAVCLGGLCVTAICICRQLWTKGVLCASVCEHTREKEMERGLFGRGGSWIETMCTRRLSVFVRAFFRLPAMSGLSSLFPPYGSLKCLNHSWSMTGCLDG